MAKQDPRAEAFGLSLRMIRADLDLSLSDIVRECRVAQPQLSAYFGGHQRPQVRTLDRIVKGLQALGVPEDRLTHLREVWKGADATAQSPASPPTAPLAPVASAPEATATPPLAPLGITIRDAENGGWVLTAVIPSTFPEVRLGEISASVRGVLARIVGS